MQNFNIELWGCVAALVVSIFAVIIIFLTRKNIVDILEKDVILFDKNFEMKKHAIERSFNLLDRVKQNPALAKDAVYKDEVKACFNELMCTVNNLNIAHAFYNIALKGSQVSLAKYKLLCRADLGLQNKHSGKIKKGDYSDFNFANTDAYSAPTPAQPVPATPAQTAPVTPVKTAVEPARPVVNPAPIKPEVSERSAANETVVPTKPASKPEPTAQKPIAPKPVETAKTANTKAEAKTETKVEPKTTTKTEHPTLRKRTTK